MNTIVPTVGSIGRTTAPQVGFAAAEQGQKGFGEVIKAAHAQLAPTILPVKAAAGNVSVAGTPAVFAQRTKSAEKNGATCGVGSSAEDLMAKAQPSGGDAEMKQVAENEVSSRSAMEGAVEHDAQTLPWKPAQEAMPAKIESRQPMQTTASATKISEKEKRPSSLLTKKETRHEAKTSAANAAATSYAAINGQAAAAVVAPVPVVQTGGKRSLGSFSAAPAGQAVQGVVKSGNMPNASSVKAGTTPGGHDGVIAKTAANAETQNTASSHEGESEITPHEGKAELPVNIAANSGVSNVQTGHERSIASLEVDSRTVENGPLQSGPTIHANVESAIGNAAPAGASASGELTLRSYEVATPRRLEVGLTGGSFGWLNVRAEMGADGSVQAMLRAPEETAGVLRAQAGELQSFLAGQASPVSHVSIESGRAAQGWAQQSPDGGAQQHQQQRQDRAQVNTTGRGSAANNVATSDSAVAEMVSGNLGEAARSGTAIAGTGGWVSVRA